jgi:hypothetical protein
MNISEIDSYEQLASYLENWMSFEDEDSYDFNGIAGLLIACLKNMNKYAIEGDFEELGEMLDDNEKELLKKFVKSVE